MFDFLPVHSCHWIRSCLLSFVLSAWKYRRFIDCSDSKQFSNGKRAAGYGLLWCFFVDSQNPAWIYISTFSQRAAFAPVAAELPKWSRKTNSFPTTKVASWPAFETADMQRDGKAGSFTSRVFFVAQTYQRYGCHSQFWYQKNFVRRVKLI